MFKKTLALLLAAVMVFALAACGNSSSQEESNRSTDNASTQEQTEKTDTTSTDATAETSAIGTVANTLAEDEDTLIATYADKFEQKTYSDSESGLSITYNLYLPEGYDASSYYPMVVFIGDSSCAGSDATVSLTQGRGGLVWATEEWQSVYPTIIAVPTYPETILDDHGSYTTTEYVELTKRYIDYMSSEYAVDTNRIYGTGQSMGCMTTLILASEYPDLYAACMFVDGQWDISTLTGLENQTFVYFAAEDDTNAWNGAQEVMSMFDTDSISYKYAQWDGNWSVDELSAAAQELFTEDEDQYFISWETGTIEPKSGGMGGSGAPSGGFGGPGGSDNSGEKPSGGFGGPGGSGDSSGMSGGPSGGTNSSSYHMASFDYAYNCVAVMEWLFQSRT
ncbi:MAG: prolyl oligopeptidase family serine peptidase [Lachnospiraceae bacterium]|nr:prolyl oligopeptidase family serine peptidase [Lachnospiraceae bacterium]